MPPSRPQTPENIPDTMTRSLSFSLPVTVVVLAIAYIYFSTVFIFIDRWFGLMSSPGLLNATVFTGVALMCVFNYTISVFRDPGRVPSTYMPDVEDSGNPIHEIKRKVSNSCCFSLNVVSCLWGTNLFFHFYTIGLFFIFCHGNFLYMFQNCGWNF